MKKIFIISQVKNEADIIESFCRYNLTYSDGMLIRDNGSSDNTSNIIQNLINEGLPIYWADDIFTKYPGIRNRDAYARKAIDEYDADLVISLDADEFLYHIDGINPREILEALREDVEYQAIWRTYVYEKEPDIKLGFMPNNFISYRNPVFEDPNKYERHKKVIASRHLIKNNHATYVTGVHFLEYPDEYRDFVKIELLEKIVFAHFPIRSKAQVMKKVIPNWIYKWRRTARAPRDILDVFQLGVLFNEIRDHGEIEPDKIKRYSLEYAMMLDYDKDGKIYFYNKNKLEKIENDLGNTLIIDGKMQTSFFANKLKLRYTDYNENSKVFIQAVLAEIDKAVTYLSTESDEKSVLLKKYLPASTSYIFLDTGKGFNPEEVLPVPLFRHGNYFEAAINLPPKVKNIRFDPIESFACILENVQIVTDVGRIEHAPMNGFSVGDINLFDNCDPQVLIEFKGRTVSYLKITGNMRHFIMDDISFLSKIKEIFIEYFETKSERDILKIEKDNLTIERDTLTIERDNLTVERDALTTERNILITERDNLLNSRSWRFTKPLRKMGTFIRKNKVLWFLAKGLLSLKRNSIKLTGKKYFKNKENQLRDVAIYRPIDKIFEQPVVQSVITESMKMQNNDVSYVPWFNALQAIPSFVGDCEKARINLVTDSIDAHHLFGGVATALIIATEFANRCKIPLRIITRTTPVDPLDYKKIIRLNEIKTPEDVSFYTDYDRDENGKKNYKLEISKKDIFVATSWWSATSISKICLTERFFYIIQEVETFFYSHNDEHYFCSKMMQKNNIDYIVNSKYLFDYFRDNTPNIVENGIYFIPAFSKKLYQPNSFTKKNKYSLFFYSRPNNPRNLFNYGIYLLNKGFEKGILDPNDWDIYLVGQNTPEITFCNGYKAINKGLLDWDQYAAFLSDVDLAVSLMYTPHPSYPPYDVACSGGVVVSNLCLNKKEFPECKNVLLGDLEENSFLETLEKGIILSKNIKERKINFEESTIQRSWHDTIKDLLAFMEEKSKNVLA
jgi:hypothetical protein